MKEGTLKVTPWEDGTVKFTYEGDGIDEEADQVIEKIAVEMDLDRYASGYNLVTGVRDICFDRQSDVLVDSTCGDQRI